MNIHQRLAQLDDATLRRLVEIAREHTALARRYIFTDLTREEKEALLERLEALKAERAAILQAVDHQ